MVLLIDSVKFGNVGVVLRNSSGAAVFQTGSQGAAEKVTGIFDVFHLGRWFDWGRIGVHSFFNTRL